MSKQTRVYLSTEDRVRLEQLISAGASPARMLTRARILLLADRSQGEMRKDREIIAALMTGICTILRTRKLYCEQGLDAALNERPRSGKPPKITGEIEAKLVMLACSEAPEGHSRWTLKLLAEKMIELEYLDSITPMGICKVLKKMNLNLGA